MDPIKKEIRDNPETRKERGKEAGFIFKNFVEDKPTFPKCKEMNDLQVNTPPRKNS